MTAEDVEAMGHGINKGLEFASLQTVCDLAIALSFVIVALVVGRSYLESIRRRLTLRVAAEAWDVGTDVLIDVLLGFVALVGLLLINPDMMADIKIGLPWIPLAMVLLAVALVLRVFHGGRVVGSAIWWIVLGLLVAGCAANWFGFTFVMEAADVNDEYKGLAASWWATLQQQRSDFNHPLAMATFHWAHPAMLLVFVWGVVAGAIRSCRCGKPAKADHAA